MAKLEPLSAQVRAAVDRSGVSRYAICKAIGFDEGAMSRFMAGEAGISLEVLDRLGLFLRLRLAATKAKK